MNPKQRRLLAKTRAFARRQLGQDATGHDWWHVARVTKTALKLARQEPKADKILVELAALLHDIADWKFHRGDDEAGPRLALRFLKSCGAEAALSAQVAQIIRQTSFKGAGVRTRPSSLEGRIVQDADRLDAMGAIGMARAFAYGGAKGRPIYEPGVKPVLHSSFKRYKKSKSHSINHFYEKLLLLKGRMNTAPGRRLAGPRHRFLQAYLRQFLREWKGLA